MTEIEMVCLMLERMNRIRWLAEHNTDSTYGNRGHRFEYKCLEKMIHKTMADWDTANEMRLRFDKTFIV
jgi:hypothetical protein